MQCDQLNSLPCGREEITEKVRNWLTRHAYWDGDAYLSWQLGLEMMTLGVTGAEITISHAWGCWLQRRECIYVCVCVCVYPSGHRGNNS